METLEFVGEDDPDPSKCLKDIGMESFEKEVLMLSSLKKFVLRKRLQKEYKKLIFDLCEVKRKLKLLDKLDKEEEENRIGKGS